MAEAAELSALLAEIRGCRHCAEHLPLGPRPVLRASPTARILVVGQAPGTAVHASGVPWDDPSGDRLRRWLKLDKPTFYDERHIAIVPMGFCYPGKGKSGDLPPRPECAPLWHWAGARADAEISSWCCWSAAMPAGIISRARASSRWSRLSAPGARRRRHSGRCRIRARAISSGSRTIPGMNRRPCRPCRRASRACWHGRRPVIPSWPVRRRLDLDRPAGY